MRVVVLALLSLCVCASCMAWGSAGIQLQRLDLKDRADQPVPGAPGQWGTLPGRLVRITFKLEKNLREAKNVKHLQVGFDAWFCPDKTRQLSFLPLVYDDRGLLDDHWDETGSSGNEVWVYIAEIGAARVDVETRKHIPAYDLRTNTEDLCLRLRARNMALQGLTTKVVRIPAAVIAEKLR